MNTSTEKIRSTFREYVAHRTGESLDEPMLETTLIRDGMYCGRRFGLNGYSLVLFAEESQIKIFNPSNSLERSEHLNEFLRVPGKRQAA